jgi:hypothetical protein
MTAVRRRPGMFAFKSFVHFADQTASRVAPTQHT